jgi:hypothetical protein
MDPSIECDSIFQGEFCPSCNDNCSAILEYANRINSLLQALQMEFTLLDFRCFRIECCPSVISIQAVWSSHDHRVMVCWALFAPDNCAVCYIDLGTWRSI